MCGGMDRERERGREEYVERRKVRRMGGEGREGNGWRVKREMHGIMGREVRKETVRNLWVKERVEGEIETVRR